MHNESETTARTAELRARLGLAGTTLVAGLGRTGLSCVRFLHRLGLKVVVADSRETPPGLAELRRELPDVACHLGGLETALLEGCEQVILSPGIATDHPFAVAARARGLPVLGDVELFARCARAPVIAITGSNGKSTVTALLGAMASRAGVDVAVGGNIGTPVLELPLMPPPELYVLELSSYQLETTDSLDAAAGVILNLSEDHLDRHGDLAAYGTAKARIHRGTGRVIWNRNEPALQSLLPAGRLAGSFGLDAPPGATDYGLRVRDGAPWLARGEECLLPVNELALVGGHNLLNALAALALGEAAGLPRGAMVVTLQGFAGLPHRMQPLGEWQGVRWYDDSKATNVGATLAALQGVPGPVVLIAGGVGKGADFSPLRPVLAEKGRAVVLLGRDAPCLAQALEGVVPLQQVVDMEEAVAAAWQLARRGDQVLLSPACASLDMFEDYAARGRAFAAALERLGA